MFNFETNQFFTDPDTSKDEKKSNKSEDSDFNELENDDINASAPNSPTKQNSSSRLKKKEKPKMEYYH